jgi:hypothetical protein
VGVFVTAMRCRVTGGAGCSVGCCRMTAAARCGVGSGVIATAGYGTGMILRIAMAGDVAASTGSGEAMAAPAVSVAPIGPGTDAKEDAVIEVALAVVACRGAGVGRVVVVAVGTDWRWTAYINADADLSFCGWEKRQRRAYCRCTQ